MDNENHIKSPRSTNLLRIILLLLGGIFMAEVIAMFLVYFYTGPYAITILIDATITTILVFPVVFFFSYRPMSRHINELEQADRILQVRLRLTQYVVSHTLSELLQETLDEIEDLTNSEISFFHFLEADQDTLWLQTWSTNTLQRMCQTDDNAGHYSVRYAGVWADCVRLKEAVIHNDYASLSHREGVPDGHVPIIRELTVPVLRENQVVAIFGVGNKQKNYTASDIEIVSTLADFAWDIIERKRAEDALHESEEKFRTLVEWTHDCEQWIDPQGDIVYISPSSERISGWLPDDFISDPELLARIVHPDDRQRYDQHVNDVHNEGSDTSIVEYRIIARDGSERWIDHICRPLFGQDERYLGRRISNRDISQRKQTEQEIAERNQKQILLTQAIHSMQMDIARDLHDTVGQNIGYLRMKLDHLSESDQKLEADLRAELINMLRVADESYDLIRGTLSMLRSGGLADPLSLFVQYANQVEERSSLHISVSSQGEPRPLPPNLIRQLFFVFRESLANIEKHANADQVSVSLTWSDTDLSLTINDNGDGFQVDGVKFVNHYGLRFMRERIAALNGSFDVRSEMGKGTEIRVLVPYEKKAFLLDGLDVNTGE